jgi:hypothetical protein
VTPTRQPPFPAPMTLRANTRGLEGFWQLPGVTVRIWVSWRGTTCIASRWAKFVAHKDVSYHVLETQPHLTRCNLQS